MLPQVLVGSSALIILTLGTAHMLYTFRGPKLAPRDRSLKSLMDTVPPGISDETTMWKAWVGFNASHSLGAILFGMIYGYLAMVHPGLLFDGLYLSSVGFLMLTTLAVLAKRYWFHIPYRGIMLALVLFTAAQVIAQS